MNVCIALEIKMVKDLFKEKLDYYKTRFKTKVGLFDLFIGNFIWGFIIVRYTETIHGTVFDYLSFLPSGMVHEYFSYLVFGLILIPFGLTITWGLSKIYKMFFKNGGVG